MGYYIAPQTYTSATNLNYSNVQTISNNGYNNWNNGWGNNWNNNWYGHAQNYYPGWNAYSHNWNQHSNCWNVYLRHGNHYKTAYFDRDFHNHWGDNDGYRW